MKRSLEMMESSSTTLSATKPLTIKDLEEKHQEKYKCIKSSQIGYLYLNYPYNPSIWSLILKSDTYNLRREKFAITCNGYSLLGIAALLSQKRIDCDNIINYKHAIKKLFDFDFRPTKDDKEVVFLIKYSNCASSIIQRILLFQHSPFAMQIPKEVIHYISSLMFKTEKSLFKNNKYNYE
ncbi:MAG TPA: hypothetical protein VKU36_05240 [Candidatus Babeliales bacterium]|nr:hypothetical protein [Candidatus Babeliales bacterium]